MTPDTSQQRSPASTGARRPTRPGIRVLLVGMIILVVAITELASYFNAGDVLGAAVRDREMDKAAVVGRVVESMLRTHAERLRSIASLLQTHPIVAEAIGKGEVGANPTFVAAVEGLLQSLGVDELEFTDSTETVVYRVQDPARRGDRSAGWGIAEALRGQSNLVALTDANGSRANLKIRAIAPLQRAGTPVGTVIVGMSIDDKFLSTVAAEAGAQLTLVGRNGARIASTAGAVTTLSPEAVQAAFVHKVPVAHEPSTPRQTVLYAPIFLVDEGFVVQVALDSQSAFRVLEAGARRSAIAGALIALVAVLLAVVMLRMALAPLRELRAKSLQLLRETAGPDIAPDRSGDEISSTVRALDSVTGHLVQQNRQLAAARDAALEASEAKSVFLSSMSHEIRTPLNGILGMADLLHGTPLTADQRMYCNAIRGSGQQLHSLLSDVLDLAKIEAGKLTLEVVDFGFRSLLREVTATYRELATQRGTALVTEIAPEVPQALRGDPTRLRQVLTNLLGNAVKFTQGGSIRIDVGTVPVSGSARTKGIAIRIADTGIGIPKDKLGTLFNPFTQADSSTTRTHGGTGLGLSICKRIVDMMDGTIGIESEPGRGTVVTVQVRFETSNAHAPVPEPAEAEAARGTPRFSGHVLVAEDNPVNQIVVAEMLAALGIKSTLVDDGAKAVEAARNAAFDLILMDCQMPVVDGFAATARIRAFAGDAARIPIVALTANAFPEDRQRCLDAGMSDYVSKPVTIQSLAQTLGRWLPRAAADVVDHGSGAQAPDRGTTLDEQVLRRLAAAISPQAAARAVRMYIESSPGMQSTLRSVSERRDFDALRIAAHALKSSSRTVGAMRVGNLAEQAEALARRRDDAAFGRIADLLQAIDDACIALHDFQSSLSDAA